MIRSPNAVPLLGAIDDLEAMDVRGIDNGGVPMVKTWQAVIVVEETSHKALDTVDYEISTSEATKKDSMEKTALAVAAIAAVDLTNLFFLLRGDTKWRRWEWTGGIPVLFAFAALLSAAGFVLALHTTVCFSVARLRVILVASAAALFMASAGTVLALLG